MQRQYYCHRLPYDFPSSVIVIALVPKVNECNFISRNTVEFEIKLSPPP